MTRPETTCEKKEYMPSWRRLPPLGQERKWSVRELLEYHDRAFVRAVYRALLGREPDSSSFDKRLGDLRSGRSTRVGTIARVRYSREGRLRRTAVHGLAWAMFVDIACSIPLAGYVIRWFFALLFLPSFAKQIEKTREAEEARLAELDAVWEGHHAILERAVAQAAEELASGRDEDRRALQDMKERLRDGQFVEVNAFRDFEACVWSELERETEALWKKVGESEAANESRLAALRRDADEGTAELQAGLRAALSGMEKRLGEEAALVRRRADELERRMDNAARSAQEKLAVAEKSMAKEIEAVKSGIGDGLRVEAAARKKALGAAAETIEKRLQAEMAPFKASAHAVRLESELYLALQDSFRGNREEVKEKLKVYLEPLASSGAGTPARPVLDIGCGRGELLELLRDAGLAARGVDESPDALALCSELGLDAARGDALEFLKGEAECSYGAVSLIHVAEHLPVGHLVDLLKQAYRVLAPGGLLIAETPNPENLLVGAWAFYLDPTHHHPLPRRLFGFLVEQAGFSLTRTLMLHPFEDEMKIALDGSAASARLNEALYGPRDYAILAAKEAGDG